MLTPTDTPNEELAEFNSSLALLKRVNEIEYEIESSLIEWRLRDCLSLLESYDNELCFAFNEKEEKEVSKQRGKIIELMNKYPNFGKERKDLRGNIIVINSDKIPSIRRELIILNKLLRKLKHKYGMGMSKKGEGGLFWWLL